MTQIGISDLSRGFTLRQQNANLVDALTRLSGEVVTGQVSDKVTRLNGHFSFLTQIETDLKRTESRSAAVAEASVLASTMQVALGRISSSTDSLASTIVLAIPGSDTAAYDAAVREARGALESTVSALSTDVAGRKLFAGVDVDGVAMASPDGLLSDLRTAISGAVSIADVKAAADVFFDTPGGGFETGVYLGADTNPAPVSLGAGETVQIDLRADNQVFRDLLKSVTLVALADDPALTLPEGARHLLVQNQIDELLSAREEVAALAADVGFAEERIEYANTRIVAERISLQMTRNELLSIDPYEAASELEAVHQQLETLYSVTARTSRLSLVNFL